jgi:hypothetical protein
LLPQAVATSGLVAPVAPISRGDPLRGSSRVDHELDFAVEEMKQGDDLPEVLAGNVGSSSR